jgi:predicted GIY-YIG superfamily endonuclease
MFHVYVIVSETYPDHYYIGFSSRPDDRLTEHNAGKNPSTADFTPLALRRNLQFPFRKTSAPVRTLSERRIRQSFSTASHSMVFISFLRDRLRHRYAQHFI